MKKIIAIICSCVLTVSAVSVAGTALADSPESNTVITETSDSYNRYTNTSFITATGENKLKGQTNLLEYYENNAVTAKLDGKNLYDNFFDGIMQNDNPSSVSGVSLVNNSSTDSYIQMQFRISGKLNDPDKFVFAFHTKNVNAALGYNARHYAVYASVDYASLFDNKIIEITNEAQGRADEVDLTGLELKDITYVAVRVYKTGYANLFITEMGFFGGKITDVPVDNAITEHTNLNVSDFSSITDKNQLAFSNVEVSFNKNGALLDGSEIDKVPQEAKKLYDGEFDAEKASIGIGKWNHEHIGENKNCALANVPNNIIQTDNYLQLEAELSAAISNPKQFVIAFHEKEAGNKYASQHYAVYASDSSETLYNSENKIIEVTDKTQRNGDKVELSQGLENIRYIGIRFYHRGHSADNAVGNIQHLVEIGLYGGTVAGDVNGDGIVDAKDLDALRKMLLDIETNQGYVYDVNGDNVPDIRDLVYAASIIK